MRMPLGMEGNNDDDDDKRLCSRKQKILRMEKDGEEIIQKNLKP